jgi:hypothetical protein
MKYEVFNGGGVADWKPVKDSFVVKGDHIVDKVYGSSLT